MAFGCSCTLTLISLTTLCRDGLSGIDETNNQTTEIVIGTTIADNTFAPPDPINIKADGLTRAKRTGNNNCEANKDAGNASWRTGSDRFEGFMMRAKNGNIANSFPILGPEKSQLLMKPLKSFKRSTSIIHKPGLARKNGTIHHACTTMANALRACAANRTAEQRVSHTCDI